MFIARTRVPWALPRFHVPLPEAPRQAPPPNSGLPQGSPADPAPEEGLGWFSSTRRGPGKHWVNENELSGNGEGAVREF